MASSPIPTRRSKPLLMNSAKRPFTGFSDVEGYCWPQSYRPGDRVELRCSSRADRFTVEVARVGATREVVWTATDVRAPNLHDEPNRHDVDCQWPVSVVIDTESSWPSGFYHVRLMTDDPVADQTDPSGDRSPQAMSDAFFVLRPSMRPSTSEPGGLLVLSTNTWNAYNQWGGKCLYSGATKVSFARPLERGYLDRPVVDGFDGRVANVAVPSDPEHRALQNYQAAGQWPLWTGSAGWFNWERRFVAWAERRGFTIDVAVNADLDFSPDVLDGQPLLLSVGHDEYWSWAMRDTVDSFVDGGGNWAIFSGNTMFWQVRYEDEGRTMVCYKDSARHRDPGRGPSTSRPERLTSMWSDPLIGRPETHSTGLTFTRGGYYRMGEAVADGPGTYTVTAPGHWTLAGTGLAAGDTIGDDSFIVAYEVDGCALDWSGGTPTATGEDGAPSNLDVVATAPARLVSITDDHCEAPEPLWASVEPPGDLEAVSTILFGDASPANVDRIAANHAVMASFTRGHGTVFNAGTTDWAYGLNQTEHADAAVDQITENVIQNLGRTQPRWDSGC